MWQSTTRLSLQKWSSERSGECSAAAAVRIDGGGWLVGDQLGLDDEAGLAVHRLDLVEHGGDRSLHEGHQPGRGEPNLATDRRDPLCFSTEHAGP
jgi:hypothetical protein